MYMYVCVYIYFFLLQPMSAQAIWTAMDAWQQPAPREPFKPPVKRTNKRLLQHRPGQHLGVDRPPQLVKKLFKKPFEKPVTAAQAAKFQEATSARLNNICKIDPPLQEEMTARGGLIHGWIDDFLVLDSKDTGIAARLWPQLLQRSHPELAVHALDIQLLHLVLDSMRCRRRLAAVDHIDFMELCAGKGNATLQCLIADIRCLCFDKDFSRDHNMMTGVGLRLWIQSLRKLVGTPWFATQCSSFVAMCLSQSQRYEENNWLGNCAYDWVEEGNYMMVTTALMMALCYWQGNDPILEQPGGSTMPKCPPMRNVLAHTQATKLVTWHGAFGGSSPKPLQLWSPDRRIAYLRRSRCDVTAEERLAETHGEHGEKFTGSGIMRESQTYSREFGHAIANMLMKGR